MNSTSNTIAGCVLILLAAGSCERKKDEQIAAPDDLFTVVYLIPPDPISDDDSDRDDDPFTEEPVLRKRRTAKEILLDEGVTFPEGAHIYNLQVSGFGLRNTQENHELLRGYLDRVFPGEWKIQEPDTEFPGHWPIQESEPGEQDVDAQAAADVDSKP